MQLNVASKRRFAHLKNARLASIAYFTRQKLERTQPPIESSLVSMKTSSVPAKRAIRAGIRRKKGPSFGMRVQMGHSLTRNTISILMKKSWNLKGLGLKRKSPSKAIKRNKMEQRRVGKFARSVWTGLGRNYLSKKKL